MGAALSAAHSTADRLQLMSFPLGYNTMNTVKMETGTGSPPTVVFHLRRIDHSQSPPKTSLRTPMWRRTSISWPSCLAGAST